MQHCVLLAARLMISRNVGNSTVLAKKIPWKAVYVDDFRLFCRLCVHVQAPFGGRSPRLSRHRELQGNAVLGIVFSSQEPRRFEIRFLLFNGFIALALSFTVTFGALAATTFLYLAANGII